MQAQDASVRKIDARADDALAEIRRMAENALREVDRMLGFHPHFTARSLGQRRRWQRERDLLEKTA